MKLHLLDNGVLVLGAENPVIAKEEGEADAPVVEDANLIPVHSFLLESPAGYILFDCACDDHGMEVWPQWLRETPYVPGENGTVLQRLAQLGVAPEEIRYVVLSHMHVDHMGCVKYFPQARTLVSGSEFVQVMKAYAEGKLDDGEVGVFHVKTDLAGALQAGVRWQPVYDEKLELGEGVTVYNFGAGHAYGMLGLLVEPDDGENYLLAADAVYSHVHYGPPAQMAGVCTDEKGYFETIEKIRVLAETHHATVLFGHDMAQFREMAAKLK